ncbi:dihydrolipoyl dehydrogenase [bacterium]|nr:dihydrolipoyl dehydrogenase [Candidatus Omnitrophota bacterium]MBU3929505.1 dihydrolipoyl dehydrogenase [bacterium]MBU4122716.1 dihydrolipoyl dehydrogenase [bacterium]
MMKKYDVIIIGGGPAGYRAAEHLAALKKKVCVAEFSDERIGGTCLNEGCVPVKAMIESAHLFINMRRSADFGIESGEIKADMGAVRAAASKKMDFLRAALYSSLKSQGIDFIFGAASFVSGNVIKIDSRELEAEYFIVASGSVPRKLSIEGFGQALDSAQILEKGFSGNNLLIVGGGYIGCEFALLYRAFGKDVTVLEALPDLLAMEDEDISRALEREFKKQGIGVIKGSALKSLSADKAGVSARIDQTGRSSEEKFDAVLSAVGRRSRTEDLNAAAAGIEILPSGAIAVDDSMRTNVHNIYAAGDVIESPMLAHTAYREGAAAAGAIAGIRAEKINYIAVPRVVFSFPQIGAIGMTEKAAASRGIETKTHKSFFVANAKAVIAGETEGFLKIISSVSDGVILGAAVVGADACELIHLLAPAVSRAMTVKHAAEVMYGHPTLSEIVSDTLSKI